MRQTPGRLVELFPESHDHLGRLAFVERRRDIDARKPLPDSPDRHGAAPSRGPCHVHRRSLFGACCLRLVDEALVLGVFVIGQVRQELGGVDRRGPAVASMDHGSAPPLLEAFAPADAPAA